MNDEAKVFFMLHVLHRIPKCNVNETFV